MKHHMLIFITILFTFNSLSSMHEPIHTRPKKHTKKLKKNKKNCSDNSIIKELFFFEKYKPIILPSEIINQILEYSVRLRDRDFQSNFTTYANKWRDFRIPIFYHHILTPQQINLMQHLFNNEHLIKINYTKDPHAPYGYGIILHKKLYYTLKSEKDYQLFLTLPKNIRICLTKAPLSAVEEMNRFNRMNTNCRLEDVNDHRVNSNKTILVPSAKKARINSIMIATGLHKISHQHECFCHYKPKLIFPEEKKL